MLKEHLALIAKGFATWEVCESAPKRGMSALPEQNVLLGAGSQPALVVDLLSDLGRQLAEKG